MTRKILLPAISLSLLAAMLAGCTNGAATGTLQFHANGEDFVRQGFVSKDDWAISFDHVYITLADITAYQTDPPYDPHDGAAINGKAEISLDGAHTIDLAEGGENEPPIVVGEVSSAPAGHYNAISWNMARATSGEAAGHSLLMIGTAIKDDNVIDFAIAVDEEYTYAGGEYVGDERKGILATGGTADLEMTFHFDHIFGDGDLPLDDDLNAAAVGFEPFANGYTGAEAINMIEMHLGHVGEGHCLCVCE